MIELEKATIVEVNSGFDEVRGEGMPFRIKSHRGPLFQVDMMLYTDDPEFLQRLMDYFKVRGVEPRAEEITIGRALPPSNLVLPEKT
jgi:hypothetical protein